MGRFSFNYIHYQCCGIIFSEDTDGVQSYFADETSIDKDDEEGDEDKEIIEEADDQEKSCQKSINPTPKFVDNKRKLLQKQLSAG